METQIIGIAIVLLLISSVVATRIVVQRRNTNFLRTRVEEFVPLEKIASAPTAEREEPKMRLLPVDAEDRIRKLLALAAWNTEPNDLILASGCIFVAVPLTLVVLAQVAPIMSLLAGLVLASIPSVSLVIQARKTKHKMTMQLPNALDLMVSVLRSGHSVPQSIKAVASEVPNPCGREFNEILHRINLGQTLSEALGYTVARYGSFELDLLRRAFHIHSEVGGSLAELLDKTNKTLRERIKLKRHIEILTGPSKLSAIIVGLLPFVMAIGFFMIAPTYLTPLFSTRLGNVMVAVALVLQVTGVLIMRRMASYKV